MTTDFEIEDNYAICYQDRLFDLHNSFDWVGFQYDLKAKEFTLTWKKSGGHWVRSDEVERIDLIHKSVTYLSIGDMKVDGLPEDDTCLGGITFFPSADRDIHDSMVDQRRPGKHDDILYFFESGRKIRIGCESVELVLGS